jgi:hypothetical protein
MLKSKKFQNLLPGVTVPLEDVAQILLRHSQEFRELALRPVTLLGSQSCDNFISGKSASHESGYYDSANLLSITK